MPNFAFCFCQFIVDYVSKQIANLVVSRCLFVVICLNVGVHFLLSNVFGLELSARSFLQLLPTDQALGARAGALLQARVRGQSRRAVLRQAPDPLRGKPGGISSQRFRALRSGGFRSTKLSTSTELE